MSTLDNHEHVYEPTFRLSQMAGTPHRRCTVAGCSFITLDAEHNPDAYFVVEYGRGGRILTDALAVDDAIEQAKAMTESAEDGLTFVVENDEGDREWPER